MRFYSLTSAGRIRHIRRILDAMIRRHNVSLYDKTRIVRESD